MININWTIIIQMINFLVLIFILNMVIYKPIRGMLKQRKAKFGSLENSILAMGKDVETRNQTFNDGIKAARQKGLDQKEALLKAATDEERAIIAQITAKAQEDLADVKKNIARDVQQIQMTLEKEVDTFADAISQKILGRAM
jgi:F-type H+-transporting ATPase subunit b